MNKSISVYIQIKQIFMSVSYISYRLRYDEY